MIEGLLVIQVQVVVILAKPKKSLKINICFEEQTTEDTKVLGGGEPQQCCLLSMQYCLLNFVLPTYLPTYAIKSRCKSSKI